MSELLVNRRQIKIHFARKLRFELLDFQIDHHEAAQTQVSRLRSSVDRTIPAKALRLENCREWLGRLKMALELPVIAFPHANRSERTLITPNQVSRDDRLFIEEWFHEDYAAFQYPASA